MEKSENMDNKPAHDIKAILGMLPHRYPFLLVDRVEAYEPMTSIHAFKNVTFNEPFFQGHFPGLPVMPGVLILEAMAQAGGVLVILTLREKEPLDNKVFLFTGMDRVKFRRPVVPGDRLDLHCRDIKSKFNIGKMEAEARVGGELVAEATLTAAMVDREGF
jgi:3-hydroxyacyl-[acyl-carrier-protein] dehydratase